MKVIPLSVAFEAASVTIHSLGKCLLHASVPISSIALIELIKHSTENQQTRRKSALMNKDEGKTSGGLCAQIAT